MKSFEHNINIHLTKKEEDLFQFLRNAVNSSNTNTTMRVAGGWVRDKLMGLSAEDIDISLDNMNGAQFGEILIKAEGKNRKNAVGVINQRPELGKFVETATVHIKGFSLDLLSLRSQVQLGEKLRNSTDATLISQAAEDAHLRDFTINSLFYNINRACVEDYTGV